MEIIVAWIVLSIIAGAIAGNKGRDDVGFFLLSILLSPLIGILAALIAKPNIERIESAKIKSGKSKRCPHCAEVIKKEANVCRYCSRDIPEGLIGKEPPGRISIFAKVMLILIVGWGVFRVVDLLFFDGNTSAISFGIKSDSGTP